MIRDFLREILGRPPRGPVVEHVRTPDTDPVCRDCGGTGHRSIGQVRGLVATPGAPAGPTERCPTCNGTGAA